MLDFKHINFEELKNTIGEELSFQLLESFYLTYSNYLEKLDTTKNDETHIKEYVHKLKGASGNLKMLDIYEVCIKLEQDPSNAQLNENLKALLKDAVNDIATNKEYFLKTQEILSLDELKKAIDELLVKIEDYSYIESKDIETIMNSLENHNIGDINSLNELKLAFSQGDYEKLEEITTKLKDLF